MTRVLFYHPDGTADARARAFVAAAHGLAATGRHVAFATVAPREPDARPSGAAALAAAAGVPVVALPAATSLVGATAELSRAVRAELAEVVFVHGARAQVVAAWAAWRAGRAAVVRRVGAGDAVTLGTAARAALRTTATGFLCTWPDQSAAVPAAARLGSVVADLGVAERAPAPDGRGCHLRCTVAPGAEQRAALVLRAAAMIAPRHRDLQLALVGSGAHDESISMHAAALGIRHLVAFDETVSAGTPDPDVAWVVADGDAGAFGALDAMAAGVPVLAERGSAPARYVVDGVTGVLLAPDDVPSTAAVLARLLGHADVRATMGAAGRSRARRTYPESAMIDGFARAADVARDRGRWRG